jgi:Predicted acetyltransferase
MEFIIRDEEPKAIEQMRAILRFTFPTEAESKLVDKLRANGKVIISLVAATASEVLGHILFSPVSTTPSNDAEAIGLAPFAVRPDFQSQGIGSQLICEGLQRCKDLDFDYCVELGNPKYYSRFGFQKASIYGLQNEYEVDDEFMVHIFSGGGPSGLLQYAPEFAELSVYVYIYNLNECDILATRN